MMSMSIFFIKKNFFQLFRRQASLVPLDGLSNVRSVRTAFALVVPEALRSRIDAVRKLHDPAFSRWPAHANLLFPFVDDPEAISATVRDRLDEVLGKLPPFKVILKSLRIFAKVFFFNCWKKR